MRTVSFERVFADLGGRIDKELARILSQSLKGQAARTTTASKPGPKAGNAPKRVVNGKPEFGAKSAFVRTMPTASAKEVIEAAAKKGITMTVAHVYNVRAADEKNGGKVKPAKAAKPEKAPKAEKAVKAKPVKAEKAPKAEKTAKLTFADKIVAALGNATMDKDEILAALKAKGWYPDTDNPGAYVSITLSSKKDRFERVSRGKYRVQGAKSSGKEERVAAAAESDDAANTETNGVSHEEVSDAGDPSSGGGDTEETAEDEGETLSMGVEDDAEENPFDSIDPV